MFEGFLDWVWTRHHNILSWYVRPLFIAPYCYFAYKRKLGLVILTLLILPTTLFWFPAPDAPSDTVLQYLDWERDFILHGNIATRLLLLTLVVVFLWLLALAFWKKSLLYGLVVLNVGTGLKVVWSLFFGGSIGYASIAPSIVTLAVCNLLAYLVWQKYPT